MTQLEKRRAHALTTVSVLRQELAAATTPEAALDVVGRAQRARQVFEAIGHSVEECNEYAGIYLAAYWKFGDLVAGFEPWRPKKAVTDNGLPGSEMQRKYARRLCEVVKESDIPDYVKVATEQCEPATIAGCLEWIDPGRHGHLTGAYEWYTPEAIVEAARTVMGGIDLDPASCPQAQETVKAAQYFTEADNGLDQSWQGRVFLNPPFAHPTVKYFAEKLLASPAVTEAIWLSNACTDTPWWHALAMRGAICFPLGRIKFSSPDGPGQSPTLGQTLIYLGPQRDRFRAVFAPFGLVLA